MATQYSSQLDFYETWQARTTGAIDHVLEWCKAYLITSLHEKSKFAAALGKGPNVNTLEPQFHSQQPFPRTIKADLSGTPGAYTVTFSGTFNGAALTLDLLSQVINTGTILQKEVSGVIHQIWITDTAIDGLTLDCAAYGGTTIALDDTATDYRILSVPWSDTRDFEMPTGLPRKIDHTYTQIFKEHVQITDTEKRLRDKVLKDPLQNKVELNLNNMAQKVASAFINGRPRWDSDTSTWLSGYDVADPTMAGILWWAWYANSLDADTTIYVDADNQPLTPQMLQDLAHNLRIKRLADINSGSWQIWSHPTTRRYADHWEEEFRRTDPRRTVVGFTNKSIIAEGKEIPLNDDQEFPTSYALLLNVDDVDQGYFDGGSLTRRKIETRGDYEQWSLREHRYGLLPDKYMQIGCIYNIRPYGT